MPTVSNIHNTLNKERKARKLPARQYARADGPQPGNGPNRATRRSKAYVRRLAERAAALREVQGA